MRMALAFEICLEIEDLVYAGIHDHGTGRGKPEIELLSPGSKKRRRRCGHVAFNPTALAGVRKDRAQGSQPSQFLSSIHNEPDCGPNPTRSATWSPRRYC